MAPSLVNGERGEGGAPGGVAAALKDAQERHLSSSSRKSQLRGASVAAAGCALLASSWVSRAPGERSRAAASGATASVPPSQQPKRQLPLSLLPLGASRLRSSASASAPGPGLVSTSALTSELPPRLAFSSASKASASAAVVGPRLSPGDVRGLRATRAAKAPRRGASHSIPARSIQAGGFWSGRARAVPRPAVLSGQSSGIRGFRTGCWPVRSRLWALVGLRTWQRTVACGAKADGAEALLPADPNCPPPILYPQRWVQLFFLAMLALLSDLVCFSVAATPGTWQSVYNEDPATLIDIFLFTNVFACFLEPYLVRRFGLRLPIIGAAVLMAVGCILRSGTPFVGDQLPCYAVMVAGTLLVAMAQPFFQCTPPLLSATWFAPDERSLATAVAINFNQVGIATAFLIGGALGGSEGGLKEYFGFVAVVSVLVAAASVFFFQERPPTPPSVSALEKQGNEDAEEVGVLSFPGQAMELIRKPGFLHPLAAFVTSITVTNVVGAFMERKLERAGIDDQGTIDLSGAGFELAIVIGGIILGGLVDRNKEYKNVTLACLAATLLGVAVLGAGQLPRILVILALLAVGSFAGPVQPINAELAVEVSYPADENAIEAVQQLCGNLASALLVPVCEWAAHWDIAMPTPELPFGGDAIAGQRSMQGDTVVLIALVVIVGIFFSTFSAPLRRSEVDGSSCLTPE